MPTEPTRPPPFFVGVHLGLDFLNSTATPAGVRTERLRDGADLLDWLVRARVIDEGVAGGFRVRPLTRWRPRPVGSGRGCGGSSIGTRGTARRNPVQVQYRGEAGRDQPHRAPPRRVNLVSRQLPGARAAWRSE